MLRFYTVDELFHKQDIDEDFIISFNKLTESSKNIIKTKNLFLKEWLETNEINVIFSSVPANESFDKEEVKFQALEAEDKNEADGEINFESVENYVTQIDDAMSHASQSLPDNTSIKAEVALTDDNKNPINDEKEEKPDNSQLLEKLDSEYKSLNFNQEILHINNLYLVLLDKRVKNCPIHKKKLTKKKILIKVNGENKKITFYACQYCKRFYALNKGEDANKLKKANIPYKFIKLDDIV